MRIGIVVHGPNIIDSGYALKLIELLKGYGDVSVRLGGTMGRTAVIDASLEKVIEAKMMAASYRGIIIWILSKNCLRN